MDEQDVAFCPHCGNTAPQELQGYSASLHHDDDAHNYFLTRCGTCLEGLLYRHVDPRRVPRLCAVGWGPWCATAWNKQCCPRSGFQNDTACPKQWHTAIDGRSPSRGTRRGRNGPATQVSFVVMRQKYGGRYGIRSRHSD